MSKTVDESLDSMKVAIDEACAKMDALRAENKLLRQVLYDLYAAMPSGYGEDRALNEALILAEKALEMEKPCNASIQRIFSSGHRKTTVSTESAKG